MEHGFFHHSRGYWQAIGGPSQEAVTAYPDGTLEVPLRPGADFDLIDGAWLAMPPDPAAILATARAAMACSRLQGRLVLGEATCAALDAMAADPLTPWAMRQTIANAIEWRRTSQAMTELGYLLGYTEAQMDDLFRLAMTVEV